MLALAAAITGCAHPPQVSSAITIRRKSVDTVAIVLKLKNLENQPTTPILVRVTAEQRTGQRWSAPQALMNPAAFVLNRKEEHTITTFLKTDAQSLRTMLTVKEAETGNLLKSERSELAVPPT